MIRKPYCVLELGALVTDHGSRTTQHAPRILFLKILILKPSALGDVIQALPVLRLLKLQATPVLFNPNALAVCAEVRDALAEFPEIEFLPIEAAGTFFIMHVVTALEAPPGCSLRRSPPSKNIVELRAFPADYVPPVSFFRVAQPSDSAAGRAGSCMSTIYASETGARSVIAACRGYMEAISMVDGRRLS